LTCSAPCPRFHHACPGSTAQGVIEYTPHLPLRHQTLLTRNVTVPRVHTVYSAPTSFESTSTVAVLGVDHFFVRTAPARAFDQLDPEFNYGMFVAMVVLGTAATLVARRMARDKDVMAAWK
jgi:hypothetical protein